MALGLLGVAVLVWGKFDFNPGSSGWAIVAALAATASYGVAAHFTRRTTAGTPALTLGMGSRPPRANSPAVQRPRTVLARPSRH